MRVVSGNESSMTHELCFMFCLFCYLIPYFFDCLLDYFLPLDCVSVSERVVGELEQEAIQRGRYLADFRYACVGYSMYIDDKEPSTVIREKARAHLPICVGVEVISA